jgi:small subunit ribosomal protein S20
MPNIKSAIKRVKQSQVRRSRNLKVLSAIKKDVKAVNLAADARDQKAADAALRDAISEIDRAVKKGTLHKNTAARKKSRLVKATKKTLASPPKAEKVFKAKAKVEAAAKKPVAKKAPAKAPAKKAETKPAAKVKKAEETK